MTKKIYAIISLVCVCILLCAAYQFRYEPLSGDKVLDRWTHKICLSVPFHGIVCTDSELEDVFTPTEEITPQNKSLEDKKWTEFVNQNAYRVSAAKEKTNWLILDYSIFVLIGLVVFFFRKNIGAAIISVSYRFPFFAGSNFVDGIRVGFVLYSTLLISYLYGLMITCLMCGIFYVIGFIFFSEIPMDYFPWRWFSGISALISIWALGRNKKLIISFLHQSFGK